MEKSLLEQPKGLLAQVIQNALDAFVVIDVNSRVTVWTKRAAELFGWTAEEAIGQPITVLIIPPELREAHDKGMQRYLSTGENAVVGRRVEVVAQAKDGQRFPVELSIARIEAENGLFFSAALRDVTQRHQHEHALREADRLKDEFLAMLAHELRNPLAPISSAAQALRTGKLAPEMVGRATDIIGRQVDHMTDLVNDLLDMSRVTRGLITIVREPVSMKEVVSDAVEQAQSMIDARHHRLVVDAEGEDVQVLGDRTRLVQVVVNLLSNAARYTPGGGLIELQMEANEEWATLCVRDNGIGIAHDVLPYVFDLFVQGARSPDRAQGGLGLGLALVRNLVEHHAGTVEADSPGPGMGSVFTVRLPRFFSGHEVGLAVLGTDATSPKAGTGMPCLIIDDNKDAAQTMAMLLETQGHQPAIAHDAQSGLELARSLKPRVLFLDIGLPDMSGLELARAIRALPEFSDAIFVAVTGYGQPEDIERSRQAGFDHHLLKPVDAEALFALIDALPQRVRTSAAASSS